MYMPDIFSARIREYISANQDNLISHLNDLVCQPSVSSTGEGVEECCAKVVKRMEEIGIAATVYPIKPYPCIVGKLGDDPAKKTVLIYAHYDVQPRGKMELWKTDPWPSMRSSIPGGSAQRTNKSAAQIPPGPVLHR